MGGASRQRRPRGQLPPSRQGYLSRQRRPAHTTHRALQTTDGAAAIMLMTRANALARALPVLGVFRSFSAVGVPPSIMGIGPAVAIPAAVAQAGLTLDDIDVFEINEAFASQARWVGTMQHVAAA